MVTFLKVNLYIGFTCKIRIKNVESKKYAVQENERFFLSFGYSV